jgi:hypothetical protein
MPMLSLKRRFGPVSGAPKARIACVAVIAALLMVMCGSAHADAELPGLNKAEPVTFRGEIAKGLKIEMRLYRDGSNLHGTYLYEAFGRDIQVKGTVNERGEITLQEFVKGSVTGTFEGRFIAKERIEGTWHKKSARDSKGRSFYLVGTGVPLAAAQVLPTQKTSRSDSETPPAAKMARTAPKAEAAARIAPTAEARPEPVSSAKQQSVPVAKEVALPKQENKIEANKAVAVERTVASQQLPLKVEPAQSAPREEPVLLPAVAQEPPKVLPVKAEAQSVEKPRVEGRTADPVKKKSSPWTSFLSLLNAKVAAAVGGILLLGGGLAWLAVIAGGAAAFRDNSALFRQAHAMGLSFLPGIFLLALGVGAVLAVFVE